jgi:hypothetical protein
VRTQSWNAVLSIALMTCAGAATSALAGPDYPAFEKVTEGFEKVTSIADGTAPLYELYTEKESGRLLAVLPENFDGQELMIACTIAGGDPQAGVMGPTLYAYWKKINKNLALIEPNLSVRTTGGKEAQDSTDQLYTGRVLLSVPILTMQGNRPVIDLGSVAVGQAGMIFGQSIYGGYGATVRGLNAQLATLTKAKAFPSNVEIEYEAPAPDGRMTRVAYSISELKGSPDYKPRKADGRVGYFYDWHRDFARKANEETTERYITRWNVKKRDPSLRLSPPEKPIVWYIEHTTPVEYRRFVREGILMWNDAFREIGIDGALEVRQQDATSGAYMDLDPEDARYNFFRWNASDQGYAIGPSRTNPRTGEILDADVVWHQGLTRAVRGMLENLSDEIVSDAFDAETLGFFAEHPQWDPRVRLTPPHRREAKQAELAQAWEARKLQGDDCLSCMTHLTATCNIGGMLAMNLDLADAALSAGLIELKDDQATLDGLPEEFLGPMIRYISAHEVGHCIGLQHNMTASTIRTLEEINSPDFSGPMVGSVMEYAAVNINHELGEVQGPYATDQLGPYDHWAIAYGYGDEDTLEDVLQRVSEPDLVWLPQPEMSVGSDPRNQTWELGKDNLEFARSRLGIVKEIREKLVDEIVEDGEPWAIVRRRYNQTMSTHLQSLMIAHRWVGGTYSNTDYKGDGRSAIEDVPAERQREAMQVIMDNAFVDDAFGLTPELIRHMGKEYYWDPAGVGELQADPSTTVHDTVSGIQATAMTLLMNPTTLRRVYDNEFRNADAKEREVFRLSELVETVRDQVWSECVEPKNEKWTEGNPMVSSFRRNLQREHVDRLITLALLNNTTSPAMRTISAIAKQELNQIEGIISKATEAKPDRYTLAHLESISSRIEAAGDPDYVINR